MDRTSLLYFDTSALIKAIIDERGTETVRQLLESSPDFPCVSALQQVELRSAIARRLSRNELTLDGATSSFEAIHDLLSLLTMVPVDDTLLRHAAAIVRTADLRSLDAIQLATALSVHTPRTAVTFVAADRKLLEAALASGLAILNPEDIETG